MVRGSNEWWWMGVFISGGDGWPQPGGVGTHDSTGTGIPNLFLLTVFLKWSQESQLVITMYRKPVSSVYVILWNGHISKHFYCNGLGLSVKVSSKCNNERKPPDGLWRLFAIKFTLFDLLHSLQKLKHDFLKYLDELRLMKISHCWLETYELLKQNGLTDFNNVIFMTVSTM